MVFDEDILINLAELYKIFADSTRVKILFILLKDPLCVSEMVEKLEMSQPAVSHQLRILRDSNLVKTQRQGKQIYYALADDHVKEILEKGYEHVTET